MPPVCPQKDGEDWGGGHRTAECGREQRKGFKEEASGPEGTERQPVKKPAFPFSKHQTQHLKKTKFLASRPLLAGGQGLHM